MITPLKNIEALRKRWPLLGYLALGTVYGWLDITTGSYALITTKTSAEVASHDTYLFLLTLSVVIAVFAFAALRRVVDKTFAGVAGYIAAPTLLGASSLISKYCDEGLLAATVLPAGAICGGIGTAWLIIGCVRAYANLPIREIVISACLSKVIGTLVYFVAIALPSGLTLGVMLLLPFAGALLLQSAQNVKYDDSSEDGRAPFFSVVFASREQWQHSSLARTNVYKLALASFTIFFIAELTKGLPLSLVSQGTAKTSYELINFGTLAICAAAALAVAANPDRDGFLMSKGFYFSTVIIIVFFISLPILVPQIPFVSWICGAFRNLLDAAIFALCCIVYRKLAGSSVTQVYALVGGFHSLGSFMGRALLDWFQPYQTLPLLYLTLGIDLIAAVLLFVVLTPKDLESVLSPTRTAGSSNEDAVAVSGQELSEGLYELFASEVGLTSRELETFRLLMRGYTANLIAQNLLISQSTVKTHLSKIYLKSGVASREELILAVEDFARRNG